MYKFLLIFTFSFFSLDAFSQVPNPPYLLYPANGAINIPIKPAFMWSYAPGPVTTFCIFQLSRNSNFDTLIENDTISPNPLPQIILQYSSLYYWRMKAGNRFGTSNWTTIFSFQTVPPPPPAPILIFPPDGWGITTQNINFDWSSIPGAYSYNIQIYDSYFILVLNAFTDTTSQYTVSTGPLMVNTAYSWRVRAMSVSGYSLWTNMWHFYVVPSGIKTISSNIPNENKLINNYPNPFNSESIIRFNIKQNSKVRLKIHNLSGREVASLINEKLSPGSYEIKWNATAYSSGVYFYTLQTDTYFETRRMLLVK